MRSRSIARLCAALLWMTFALPALADAPTAKAHLARGASAAKNKDFATALTEFAAARALEPSADAELGVASSADALGHLADAYNAYSELMKTFGASLPKKDRATAEARLKDLATKTGTISIHVSENGARITLDENDLGTSPAPPSLRADVGAHHVHAEKEGFSSFDSTVTVTASGRAVVEIALAKKAKTGHVAVTDPSGEVMRVLVDGVDVGATPWEGDLPPGSHTIAGRSSKSTSPPSTIEVNAGETSSVKLSPSASTGRIEITTSDGQGTIFLDGKQVGDGSFASELPVGPHAVSVKRDGYETFEKKIDLQEHETLAETVTLRASAETAARGASKRDADRPFSGVYGGLGLAGLIEPNGNGNSLETSCSAIGASSCSTPPPLGATLFGYGGYSWNPIGLELFLGATFDEATPSANYTANSALGSVVGGPPRTEQFIFPRLGGVVAVRARATLDGRTFRVSFSAGPGLAYKDMFLFRKVQTQDGTNRQGKEVSDAVSYVSPALVADLAVRFRLSPAFAISGGVLTMFENAGDTHVDTQNQVIASASAGAPLRTFSYDVATGAQFFIGPYFGAEFGP